MNKLLKGLLFSLLMITINPIAFAQADVWFLGNNISIDFSSGTAVVGTGIVIGADLTESSTSITDPSGKLLFSVVGDQVYDGGKNAVLNLPAGTWDVAQGTMVIPVPGKTNEYYLTVLKGGTGASTKPTAIYYTIKTNGTNAGNLTITGPANLAANLTQSQTGVPKLNPDGTVSSDYWLISHQLCNNSFQLFTVSGSGITNSGTSNAGPNLDCINTWPPKYDDIGTLKFNGCYTQATYVMGDKVMLFDFDAKTGQFTHKNTVTTGLSSAYSMEFSPDGKYAYVLTGQDNNNPGRIYRMAVTGSGLGAPVDLGVTGGMRGGHLQLGPDGNIYFAAPQSYGNLGTGYIGRITNPNGGGVVDKTWYKAAAEDNNTAKIEGQAVNMDMPNFLKSLVVPLPKLLVDGVELSQTSVCQGQSVKFELSVSGSVAANVDWVATGANTGSQNGGASFTMTMTNAGTTNVTATVTDECGRQKDVPFEVEIEPYQNANGTLAVCPSRVVTGTGSTSGQYAWYTADPKSGGTFLGYGATYDADGLSNVWVQPTSAITQTNINDTRAAQNFGNASGGTSVAISSGSGKISSFDINTYTWASYSGNLVVELRDKNNVLVGTAVTKAMSGTGQKANVFSPTDWNINAANGPYFINVTSTAGASFGQLTTNSFSSGTISLTGGRASQVKITTFEEASTLKCFNGKLVPIPDCCTQLAPTNAITTGTPTVCVGTSVVLTATKDAATTGTVTYQWYNDDGAISGATSATYTVPTGAAAAAKDYWVTVTSSGSCSGESPISNKIKITVNAQPTKPVITVSPNKSIFCKGENYTLTANSTLAGGGAVSYTWSVDGAGTSASTAGKTSVGSYTYVVQASSNGCSDTASRKIIVNALPDSTINPLSSYCGDVSTPVNLSAVTAGGSWKVDNVALGGSSFVPKNYSTGMHVVEYDVTANGCSSDDTVQFHIIKKDTADITAAGPFCKNAAAVTLKAVNSGGTWTGTGITSATLGTFNPKNATVGTNTITYTITGTCGDTKTKDITVNATDSAKINTVGAMCSSSPAITLNTYLTAGSTTGGTWSGTGITNTSTGAFDPSSLSQGTYKVKYTTGGACPTADSTTISITNGVNLSFLNTQKTSYCQNSPMDTMKVSQLLSGGVFSTFSGKGITDATNGYYNPALANVGVDTVYYIKSGMCGDTVKAVITVNAIDSVEINPEGVFCQSDLAKQLTVTAGTAAGTWTASCGACISAGGLFNPTTAGATAGLTPAYHTITYTTNGSCKSVDTIHVTVVSQMVSNILNADTTVCKNGTAFKVRLSSNSTPGGTWLSLPMGKVDNAGNFNPVTAGEGVFTIYYGVQGSTLLCSAVDSVKITVTAIDTAKITLGQGPFCLNDPALTLAKETVTSAGVWSGTGITNTATGEFTPVTAGVGPHLITYTTTGGCPVQDTLTVTVVNQMVADITTPNTSKCKNAAAFNIALSGTTTAGGTWSSVPAGKVDNAGSVNPATAGVGVFWVYYELTGATSTCSAKDSVEITVTAIDTAKITLGQGPFCLNDPAQTLLKEAASSAGTWSGTGITSGAAGTFNPLTAGVGSHKITYTTSGACPVFDTLTIGVVNQMVANITTADNTNICVDNGLYQVVLSGNSTAGGTWSSVPAGLVDNTGKFNPQLAGVASNIMIKYAVSGATATCSARDSIMVNVLPREEAQITDGATKTFCTYDAAFQLTPLNAGGTWAGTGVTAGGLFTPSAAGAGGPYAIRYKLNGTSSLCPDEDTIMITIIAPTNAAINAAGPYCENLGLQQLSGVVPGGTFSGVGVSAGGSFDPAAAGAGTHWIKYTQNGQCPNVDSIEIVVEPLPEVKPIPDVAGGCVPLLVNFGDSSTSASQIATWDFGDGAQTTLTSSNASFSHTYTKVGTFDVWLDVQFQNGCKDKAQTKVTVTEVPEADFSFNPEPASTLDPTVFFTNQSTGATNYLWDFGVKGTPASSVNADEMVKFAIDSAVAHGYDSIPVKLKASNAVCADSIIKKILLKDIFTMYTPNAFSPNGDGFNDLFYPMGANHKCDACTNYEFMVFNRWGEIVFRTTTPYEGWNGKRSNTMQDAQIDVYVWRVVYTDSYTGKEGKQMGAVTLMR